MNRTNTIRKLNMRLANSVSRNFPAKVIGGFALGALLAVATALPLSPAQASPLSVPPVEKLASDIESTFGLGEEWFHPITGELTAPLPGVEGLVLSGFGPAEENFHPITGE